MIPCSSPSRVERATHLRGYDLALRPTCVSTTVNTRIVHLVASRDKALLGVALIYQETKGFPRLLQHFCATTSETLSYLWTLVATCNKMWFVEHISRETLSFHGRSGFPTQILPTSHYCRKLFLEKLILTVKLINLFF